MLSGNYLLSSTTLSFKNNGEYSKKCEWQWKWKIDDNIYDIGRPGARHGHNVLNIRSMLV